MLPLFAAYLRVYEPLAAFDRDRQRYWRRYARSGRAVPARHGPDRQRAAVLAGLGAGWSRLPELPDEAYVLEVDGTLLVCPWNLRFRVAEAALTARDGVPGVIADAFVPPGLAVLARDVVDDWRSGRRALERGLPRVHEQVSTWGVPLRWFAFVDATERALSLPSATEPRPEAEPRPGAEAASAGDPAGGATGPAGLAGAERGLRYRTEITKARRRASRATSVLRQGVGNLLTTIMLEETAKWLDDFHPRSWVELDYGGLVDLLPDDVLLDDDSPDLVAKGISAVARGDSAGATDAYQRLVDRWRAVQRFERYN